MTDTMKCPICGTPLEYDIGYDGDYSCAKCGRAKMFGSEELWQELIRTRKALDVAINAIESAKDHNVVNCVACRGVPLSTDDVHITLCRALAEIKTALEQND